MRILSHYFIARFLGLFATALTAAVVLLATVELVLNLDDLSTFSPSAATADPSADPGRDGWAGAGSREVGWLRFLWVRLASYYLPDLFPIASFAAAFIAFSWAGRALELVAIQAGGIRLARVVVPVLGAALILSLASAILHETVVLRADRIWSLHVDADAEAIDFGREAFWHQEGRMITNVTHADAATRTLHGVEIFERGEDGTILRVIRADRVRVDARGTWLVGEARVWTFDPTQPDAAPRVTREIDLQIDHDALGGGALLGAAPALLPLPSLARYLAADADATSANHRRLTNRFHERLSRPWLVFLFALVALPFALRVDQTGRIVLPALGAIAALGLFFVVRSVGVTLAQEQIFPVGLAPWLSMGIFGGLSLVALRRAAI